MADLNTLGLFSKVVEAGSFSEAARRLKIPVSTLSRRIAELEGQLGVSLLERSTRRLRLTDVGAEVLEHARRGSELSDAIDGIVSNHRSEVTGTLRLTAPPSISDSVLAPIVIRFQQAHPSVRVQVFISERPVDLIAEGMDLAFQVDPPPEPRRGARPLLVYRHRLVASPAYLARHPAPLHPKDLLRHPLLAFSRGKPSYRWTFLQTGGTEREHLTFEPHLAMNDYAGLATALVAGVGIGDLPPIVLPRLVTRGKLVEVMPSWHFRTFELTLKHAEKRFLSRPVRLFRELAEALAPTMFPDLPT